MSCFIFVVCNFCLGVIFVLYNICLVFFSLVFFCLVLFLSCVLFVLYSLCLVFFLSCFIFVLFDIQVQFVSKLLLTLKRKSRFRRRRTSPRTPTWKATSFPFQIRTSTRSWRGKKAKKKLKKKKAKMKMKSPSKTFRRCWKPAKKEKFPFRNLKIGRRFLLQLCADRRLKVRKRSDSNCFQLAFCELNGNSNAKIQNVLSLFPNFRVFPKSGAARYSRAAEVYVHPRQTPRPLRFLFRFLFLFQDEILECGLNTSRKPWRRKCEFKFFCFILIRFAKP